MNLLVVFAGIPLAIVQASVFEWAFHRYWLHRPWLPKDCFTSHTLVHHQLCKFDDTFHVADEEQHEALTFAWWGGPVLIAINMIPWLLLTWALAAANVRGPHLALLIVPAAVFGLYYVGYEGLHYLMHKPGIAWIERSRYFRFLERHHRIHHVQMDRNLNVLVPVGDFLLGTLVREAPRSGPTSPGARKLARRHSQFGKRLREEKPSGDAPGEEGVAVEMGDVGYVARVDHQGGLNAPKSKAFDPDEAEGTAASGQGH